jgi:hypothetical protein
VDLALEFLAGYRDSGRVPLDVLAHTIQPFPTFSEIHLAALKALRSEIAPARRVEGVA